jgi:hypothetical protein
VHNALVDLDGLNAERIAANQASLIESADRRQIFRWASKFTGASIQKCHGYTHWELVETFVQIATTNVLTSALLDEFGVSRTAVHRFEKKALAILNIKSMKLLKMGHALEEIAAARIRSAANSVEQQRKGQKPYLSADEEALVVATAPEIKRSHSQPVQRKHLAVQLNSILEKLADNPKAIAAGAKRKSQLAYARNVIRRVNAREPGMEGQTKTSFIGETRVSGLSNSRA